MLTKMDAETKAQFERLNKKLNELIQAQKKETWVTVSWVTKLTDWDPEELRMARDQKIVEFKRSPGGGYLYKLESIPEQFIKSQKQAS